MSTLVRKYIQGEGWQTVVDDGGGSDFNGGTITEPLRIESSDEIGPALMVLLSAGAEDANKGFQLQGPSFSFDVNWNQGIVLANTDIDLFTVTPTGAVTISPSDGSNPLRLNTGDPANGTGLTITQEGDGYGQKSFLDIDTFGGIKMRTPDGNAVQVFHVTPTGAVTISPSEVTDIGLVIQGPTGSEAADNFLLQVRNETVAVLDVTSAGEVAIRMRETWASCVFYDNADGAVLMVSGNGTVTVAGDTAFQADVGFNGAPPVGIQVVPLTAPSVQDVIDALIAYNLINQSD